MNRNISFANDLMQILESENLTEIAYEEAGVKILLKREYKGPQAPQKPAVKKEISHKPATQCVDCLEILSHNIGIFQISKKNGEAIAPGSLVKEGDEIGYVSSMGVKNPIISDFTGTVVEVLVKDGDIVDFTKPVLTLKK